MTIPTPAVDARQLTPTAPPPAPYPGFVALVPLAPAPVPPYGTPPAPVPPQGTAPYGTPLGVPPAPIAPYGMPPSPIPPFGAPQFGMPPAPVSPFGIAPFGMPLGVPPAPIAPYGMPPSPIPPFGIAPYGMSAPIAPFGTPLGMQLGVVPPPAPVSPFGIAPFGMPLGVPPAPVPGVIPPPAPVSPTAAFLLGQIALKEAASTLGEKALNERVIAGANEAIARSIEDLAGVTLHPWSRAWALAWIYPVVTELALLAHRYQEGTIRAELLNVAGQLLSKGLAPIGEGPTGGRRRE